MRKTGFWLSSAMFFAFATFAGALAQEKPKEAAPSKGAATALKGEDIMNLSCLGCHEVRPIQMQALDKDAWTKKVQAMIAMGAEVKPAELPILVDYLVKEFGPVPEGNGKAILLNICTQCHNLDRIKSHKATREEWDGTLSAMLNEGAPLSDEDYPIILNYLTRNFRP
jgi:cytochrome c2